MFSAPMVRKILSGEKTQTRRLVTAMTSDAGARWGRLDFARAWADNGYLKKGGDAFLKVPLTDAPGDPADDRIERVRCRYRHGDRLWVRETWRTNIDLDDVKPRDVPRHAPILRVADYPEIERGHFGWGKGRPAIFMLPWMSRITLDVISIRVERLQDISENDAIAEGVTLDVGCPCEGDEDDPGPHVPLCRWNMQDWPGETPLGVSDPNRMAFAALWDSINKKRVPWSADPWTWVIDFRRVAP
jgi:hypothetical protein